MLKMPEPKKEAVSIYETASYFYVVATNKKK